MRRCIFSISKRCIQFNQMEADAESIEAKMLISAKLLERMVSCHCTWVKLPQLRKRIFYIDNLRHLVMLCFASFFVKKNLGEFFVKIIFLGEP